MLAIVNRTAEKRRRSWQGPGEVESRRKDLGRMRGNSGEEGRSGHDGGTRQMMVICPHVASAGSGLAGSGDATHSPCQDRRQQEPRPGPDAQQADSQKSHQRERTGSERCVHWILVHRRQGICACYPGQLTFRRVFWLNSKRRRERDNLWERPRCVYGRA